MKNMGGAVFVTAALIFAISAVAFGAAVVDAIRVEEVGAMAGSGIPSHGGEDVGSGLLAEGEEPIQSGVGSGGSEQTAEASQRPLRGMIYPKVTDDEIRGAVNQDLFQPDRNPSVDRYLFPSERAAPTRNSGNDRRSRGPDLRIVGTAIAGDLALALVQPDDSIPFAVLLGETVDGYTLATVSEESVTLVRDENEFTFPVVEPQRGRSSNNRERNTRNRAVTEDAARALMERAQQMIQGVQRGQGGSAIPNARAIQLQFVPGTDVIRTGGPGGRTVTVVRPRGGGSGGGGGSYQ